ncbi:M48 family metallopeptidase [Prosthecobacter sp.]|uniref:M48 family metallopeptidase n=1 Tax=Prosthecobacter sp. TaxID=1965333 RepID=UPI001DCC3412|nr:M48 family metallopeptidase [Prosthecobacter sp.]MCB1274936.1 M48 family metallopeptidase [Prosthecobacter sp.]
MTLSNPWFIAAVVGVLGVFHLELVATFLNLAQFRHALPQRLKEIFPDETVLKAGEYASKSARLDLLRSTLSVAVLVAFWWVGGFGAIERWSSGWGWGEIKTGVGVIGVLLLVQNLLSLPFDAWDTFKIEAEYGFNRTTVGTFIADRVKGLLLTALLGGPLLALVLWFFQTQAHAVLYTWLTVAIFSIVMAWLSPRLLMPLFLKFQPLESGPLRETLLALAARLKFPVVDVSVVDGSRRSSKANAFLSGFGKNKRIALFDTLIEKHSTEELEAILAHEIGHHKCRHVPQQLVLGLLESGLMFYLLHQALQSKAFFQAFGVAGQHLGLGLVLFSIVYQPASLLLGMVTSALSRRHEFQADAFARSACGNKPLMTGLKKLSLDHLTHPNPHKLTVWLHYSHPPIGQRLAALEA